MKILVTGGNGFIGSHLCEDLVNSGYSVTCLDINFDSNTKNLDCEKVIGDITDNSIVERIKNYDMIIHLAAISRVDPAQKDPIKCYNVNVLAVVKIIEALKNSKTKFIFGSSREVYGEPKSFPVLETDEKNPLTIYGSSKLASEQLLRTYRKLYDLNYLALRFSNVFGSPRDLPQRVIPTFIDSAINGSSLTINGGNQVIDFTFIDDVVDGISKVVKKMLSDQLDFIGQEYNFASGIGTTVIDLAKKIKKIFDSNSELKINEQRNYDVQKFIGDYNKAREIFSFEPKHSLDEGLVKYQKRLPNMDVLD